jgi:type II secretory pathway pseudopilin PulG
MAFCAYCGKPVDAVSYKPCASCGNPSNGAPRPVVKGGTNAVLIIAVVAVVGLIAIAIVGILAAIAIPNLLTAMQRSKQMRTIADVRTLATALEAYATDNNKYPDVSSVDDLRPMLVPKYIKALPTRDGWGHAIRYECVKEQSVCTHYIIASAGKDGQFEHDDLLAYRSAPPGPATNFDCDIVYADGAFLEYPQGVQRQ